MASCYIIVCVAPVSGRRKRKNRKDKMSGVNEEPNGMMPSSGDERNDEKDGGIDPEKEGEN